MLAFRQRGPDDERMSELDPLPSSCPWSEYPSCGMVTQPREFQEARGRGEQRNAPSQKSQCATAAAWHLGGGNVFLVKAGAIWVTFMPLVRPSVYGSHEDERKEHACCPRKIPGRRWFGFGFEQTCLDASAGLVIKPRGRPVHHSRWRREKGASRRKRATGRKR